jgi:hypothetical protein
MKVPCCDEKVIRFAALDFPLPQFVIFAGHFTSLNLKFFTCESEGEHGCTVVMRIKFKSIQST